MKIYKQLGNNKLYPDTITTWKLGETIPDWLSDIAKITFIDAEGNKTLATINYENGYEIIDSSGSYPLIRLKDKNSLVCFGNNKIFGLTKKQFELLYENNI